ERRDAAAAQSTAAYASSPCKDRKRVASDKKRASEARRPQQLCPVTKEKSQCSSSRKVSLSAIDIILSVRVVGELGLGYNWAASILCVRNMEDCDAVPQRRFHFPQLLGRCLHRVRLHRVVLAAHHSIHGPVPASRYLRLAESNLGDSANRIPAPCRVGVSDHAKPRDGRAKYPTSSASAR